MILLEQHYIKWAKGLAEGHLVSQLALLMTQEMLHWSIFNDI